MDSNSSTALVPIVRCFTDGEEVALAGFLAGYRGSTREAYALDLRQFALWCANHERRLFEVHRLDIECFGRELETRGRARATIARRLCAIAGFYRYAEEEGLIAHSPAIHVRRPRLDYESHATGLDRNELGALLVAAGLSSARDHALVPLLALNGLRVSEALGADIDALGLERGHRTLTVIRKGGKVVTMPLAPRVARVLDLAIGERLEGPIFVDSAGERLDRHAAGRIVRRVADMPGSPSASDLTLCGTRLSPLRSMPACRCVTSKKQPATLTRAPRCATTEDANRLIATPPTSSPRSSLAPRDKPPRLEFGRRNRSALEPQIGQSVCVPGSTSILAEQLAYYRAVANEYENYNFDVVGLDELLAAIDAFRPTGDVLELACGAGIWTPGLARSATSITAVDAAPEMLARARARNGVESVDFVEADLFAWRPDRRYDTVFFGFWLSHVPEEHFESFWSLVGESLRPGGNVFFFDDNYRTEAELIEGKSSPIVERRLKDGRSFRVVKVPFRAEDLERRLRAIGWDIVVTPTAGPFYWGTGGR